MKARLLTLTGVGLPVRAELRLKSLLEIVNARTADRWSFVERDDVHVAICNPSSALLALAMKRSAAGATRFYSLVEDSSLAAAGTGVIRDPIRANDLIELLNLVSSTMSCEVPEREWAALASTNTASSDGRDVFPVAVALRGLARAETQTVYALEAGTVSLHVVPATRTVLLSRALDLDGILRLAAPGVSISIRELPATHARVLADGGAQTCKLDALLWRLGLHGDKSRLLPELPADACFKLRRWPDFGRIEHTADHLRLAARLARQQTTVLELAMAAALPVSTVNSFINACCLCELVEVQLDGAKRAARGATLAAQPTRYIALFQTIRSVLRFGVSS